MAYKSYNYELRISTLNAFSLPRRFKIIFCGFRQQCWPDVVYRSWLVMKMEHSFNKPSKWPCFSSGDKVYLLDKCQFDHYAFYLYTVLYYSYSAHQKCSECPSWNDFFIPSVVFESSISEWKEAPDWFHLMARDVLSTRPLSCGCGFDDESWWRCLFSSWWGWRWMDNNHSCNGKTDSFPAHTALLKCLFTCALFAGAHIYWKRDWTNLQSILHLNHNCWVEKVKGCFFLSSALQEWEDLAHFPHTLF